MTRIRQQNILLWPQLAVCLSLPLILRDVSHKSSLWALLQLSLISSADMLPPGRDTLGLLLQLHFNTPPLLLHLLLLHRGVHLQGLRLSRLCQAAGASCCGLRHLLFRGAHSGGTEPDSRLQTGCLAEVPPTTSGNSHTCSDVAGQVQEGKGGSVHLTRERAMHTVVLHQCTRQPST